MEYSVYIVKCNDGTLYTGISNNVNNRVVKHNKSRGGSKYTRGRQPVRLVYSKVIGTKSDALKEEYRIKQLSRSEKLKLLSTTNRIQTWGFTPIL
jgi:putative endonuclease